MAQLRVSLAAAIICIGSAPWSSAEDIVIIAGAEGRADARHRGVIVEYTGQELLLRQSGGRDISIPAERVAGVETQWPESYLQAQASYAQRDFDAALAFLQGAAREEQRRWARREILAEIVRCYGSLGRIEEAARTFVIVASDDPKTRHIAIAPLAWTARQPSPSLQQSCQQWAGDEKSGAVALLGASWLLSSADRAKGTQTLQRLSAGSDDRIASLAAAQLWRTRLGSATMPDAERWRSRIESMPFEIRGGPYYLLGLLLARLEQHEQAALALLRAPLMHSSPPALLAEALLAAGREMERAGQIEESQTLFREVAADYRGANAALEAESRLRDTGAQQTQARSKQTE